ncbi:Eco57I restriction-modification methylase domain-containing protein, partial [Thermococcus sp.]
MTEIVMGFFEAYNFTVTEETPYEVEVAVDPAMLGKIYESLIAEEEQVESEEEKKASGIFYTPRSEVDFMCRMAVYQYLERNTKLDKDVLMKFVFTPPYDWDPKSLSWEEIDVLENALRNVKVVDPAAGSGAFLVGMYHLLIELHEKLTEDSRVTYKKKLEIIRDNIYGVDIKDWAIRVAKLRLWLALIEGEGRIPNEPILPNLETKLAIGDSLAPPHFVLKIGNKKKVVEIPLAKFRESLKLLWAKKGVSEAIVAYKQLVKKYYMGEKSPDGQPITLRDIEHGKWMILHDFLKSALSEEIKAKEKKELALLIKALESEDLSALERPPFIWELDFPDVMLEKRGFDIVIANPPYVRQEKIYPEYYDLAEFQMLPKKERDKLKKDYKNGIKTHMELIIKEKFEHEMKLPGRS